MTMTFRRSFRLVCSENQIPLVESLLEAQGFRFEPEPFFPLARRLVYEPMPLGRSIAAFWGFIYIQDRSSMLPPLALAPEVGNRVLDMCASPGSKTGLLAQLVGKQGVVLGNEPDRQRLATLRRNLLTLNLLQTVTCSWPGEHLPLPDGNAGRGWNRILLDPPCSGWGTTDRHPQAIKMWQGERIKPLIALQRALLTEAARLLNPGGRLIYSTCTTNIEENEAQIRFAVHELGLEPVPLSGFPGFHLADPLLPEGEGTLRIDEAGSEAQGFYIACLRKPGTFTPEAREADPLPSHQLFSSANLALFGMDPALLPPGELACFKDTLHFLPEQARFFPASVRWQGMALGKCSGQGPYPRLRALFGPETTLPRLVLEDVQLLEGLLQGQSLRTDLPGKQAVLYWRELPLARIRLQNGRALWSA